MRLAAWFLVAAVAAPAWSAAPAGAPGLAGRWRMVEQTYEAGAQNLADRAPALHLEVAVGTDGAVVRTWADDDVSGARAWPAPYVGDRFVDPVLIAREVDVASGRLTARYRVGPVEEGGLLLELEERYDLDRDADVLVGTVEVRMSRDGEPRGGYVLHRRYARER